MELAEASPLPPPFPDAAHEEADPPRLSRGAPRGLAVATTSFLLVISIGAGALWFASAGHQTGLGTSVATPEAPIVETAAAQVAIVAEDGTILRGQLWRGDATGIIVTPGYSDDAADAHQVAESLSRSGHTVMFYNLRGQRPSGGLAGAAHLPADLRAAVADMRTRGIDHIYVVGYRQSATAAVILAAEPSGLDGVAAVFAYERYQELDAAAAAEMSTAPLLFIAAEGSKGQAGSAANLAAAHGKTEPYILSERPPAALSSDHFSPKVVNAVLQFVAGDS